jgi:quinoprotein glucose dehydrogenase
MGRIRTLCLAGALVALASPAAAQNGAPPDRSVRDGVYSKPQAARGKATFGEVCGNCHSTSQFRGDESQMQWDGRSVNDLFAQLRTTMPIDNPGGLTPQEYAAVIAYVLELNGYPAGGEELPAAAEPLKRIRIETRGQDR